MNNFSLPELDLECQFVPWDTAACGFPVAQMQPFQWVNVDTGLREAGWRRFEDWREQAEVGLVSCRLPVDRFAEGVWLESHGFRSIETVLHPEVALPQPRFATMPGITLGPARPEAMPAIAAIAETAFDTDRFSVDLRLPRRASGKRYRNWIERISHHPGQQLFQVEESGTLAGFFLWEELPERTSYWHLTAIGRDHQGRGCGRRSWESMLHFHQQHGIARVRTTISARNLRVLNLYAGLGFRFHTPQTTWHWVRT